MTGASSKSRAKTAIRVRLRQNFRSAHRLVVRMTVAGRLVVWRNLSACPRLAAGVWNQWGVRTMAKGVAAHIGSWARQRSGTNGEQTRFLAENWEEAWEMGWSVDRRSDSRKKEVVSRKVKTDERRSEGLTRWSGRRPGQQQQRQRRCPFQLTNQA